MDLSLRDPIDWKSSSLAWIEHAEVGGGEEPLHEDAFEATAAAAAAAYMA